MSRLNYSSTVRACYLGYVTQAIVNNFSPLLFVRWGSEFGISLAKITSLITVNFCIQLVVDLLSVRLVDKIGYRVSAVGAHILCFIGLSGLAWLPQLMSSRYAGILVCMAVYAVGGGLTEVIISPIVEAAPFDNKSSRMSLLHSFYCWGHVLTVAASTLFFTLFGIGHWRAMAAIWSVVPLFNAFFFAFVPISSPNSETGGLKVRELFASGVFMPLLLCMFASGAAEQGLSQWASSFAEAGLHINKTAGDLAGPCLFAALMGLSRIAYSKWAAKMKLVSVMEGACALCIAAYCLASFSGRAALSLTGMALCGFSVGIMWPGSFSISCRRLPEGGTSMFALLALAGDLGCAGGPFVVGHAASAFGGELKKGLAFGIIFPVLLAGALALTRGRKRSQLG